MSRRKAIPQNPDHEVIVGWDAALGTFFAQVCAFTEDCNDGDLVLWVGMRRLEIETVESLAIAIRDYATIPDDLTEQLEQDRRDKPAWLEKGRNVKTETG